MDRIVQLQQASTAVSAGLGDLPGLLMLLDDPRCAAAPIDDGLHRLLTVVAANKVIAKR